MLSVLCVLAVGFFLTVRRSTPVTISPGPAFLTGQNVREITLESVGEISFSGRK
jgi:hypothetical protein